MSLSQHARLARVLAIAVPALLLGGAYVSEYGFGLYPCEMCWWQRWPHFAAFGFALLAYVVPPQRLWIGAAALAILVSGAIGLFHAGVEYGWWPGITSCAVVGGGGSGNALEDIMNTPLVRCDAPAWTLFGISLAGYNFLISTAAGVAIVSLLMKDRKA
ncbi:MULTISPECIES: disulfide bond formation protein B [unclassified Erythrobacter]|uniref:disulfide bond formation protein B n=1 Tax=unclassified Erythrobacter TaxID=2633097 RepID=UPI00076CFD75|nr:MULTISPECIES: disulfide bond formation protein B [unclassified Erythrobacter]KWV94801.1 disulfide bond formation protein [Erythrobacter sp. AP23]MBO6527293.1 disulfide bond formation protein B [Erythrobacter sp.]MBO6530961.1 disulfide bond formation protein B [Erythrobacter sp.]